MSLKKLPTLLFASFCLSTAPLSAHQEVQKTHQFYIGLNGGGEWLSAERTAKVVDEDDESIITENKSGRSKSGLGAFVLGYQWQKGCYLAGLELSAQLTNIKNSVRKVTLESTLQKNFAIGLVARAGLRLKHISPYLKCGLEGARFSQTFQEFEPAQPTVVRQSKKSTAFKPVFVLGAGVEKSVTKNIALRLEYTCRFYAGIKNSFKEMDGATVVQSAKKIRSNAVTLGAIYAF